MLVVKYDTNLSLPSFVMELSLRRHCHRFTIILASLTPFSGIMNFILEVPPLQECNTSPGMA